jgi:hypothetical protein
MAEVGKRYKIVDKIIVAFIDPDTDEQCEVLVDPGAGEFWFDGSNIMFEVSKTGRVITTTWINSFIDQMVESGRLAPSEEG